MQSMSMNGPNASLAVRAWSPWGVFGPGVRHSSQSFLVWGLLGLHYAEKTWDPWSASCWVAVFICWTPWWALIPCSKAVSAGRNSRQPARLGWATSPCARVVAACRVGKAGVTWLAASAGRLGEGAQLRAEGLVSGSWEFERRSEAGLVRETHVRCATNRARLGTGSATCCGQAGGWTVNRASKAARRVGGLFGRHSSGCYPSTI